MSTTNTNLQILSESDKQRLDSILIAFDMEWTEELLPVCVQELPPPGSLLRHAALLELIKIELDRQWRQGRQVLLEQYLEAFPELGTRDTVPVCLILAEYEARKQWDQGASLSTFAERFPARIGDVQNHMENTQELEQATHAEMAEGNVPGIAGYEILGVLGKGGMGIVYKARHRQLDRLVALKMILHGRHASANELARFAKEMEAVARLRHPGIVQLYEVGEQKGLPYCVLEFCPGGNLTRRLAETTLPPVAAAELVEQLARAIHEAHEHHIIHRDLKPDNVLFVEGPETPLGQSRAKIVDFGLAKKLDDGTEYTQSGAIVGTPSYMAPEQASSEIKTIGPATDIFALGAVLYECLTGRPPFKGATVHETLYQLLHEEPVSPRQMQAHTPRDLETICLKCLQKEPNKRYASAAELADDLKWFREGVPIKARRVTAAERFWRWCRRHPAMAALSASVLLLLIAVAGISTVSALWLRYEQQATLIQLGFTKEAEEKAKAAEQIAKKQLSKTQQAERQTKQQLLFSKLAQARAARLTGLAGQRFESLRLLREAAAMLPLNGRDENVLFQLRNEYIACSALQADLRVIHERKHGSPMYFGQDFQNYLYADAQGDLHLCRRRDNHEIAILPCGAYMDKNDYYWEFRFSPDDRFLAVRYHGSAGKGYCLLWNVIKRKKLFKKIYMRPHCFPLDFSPDNSYVVFQSDEAHTLRCFDLDKEKLLPDIPQFRDTARFLNFRPDGKRLAVLIHPSAGIALLDVESGKSMKHRFASEPNPSAWSPDGQFLAIPVGMGIVVRDLAKDEVQARLTGHRWFGATPGWARHHDLLWSRAWDGSSRLWHPLTGTELVRTSDDRAARYSSASDNFLSFTTRAGGGGVWEIAHSQILRQFPVSADKTQERHSIAIHPNGRLLACGSNHGLHLCDLGTGREIAVLAIGNCYSVQFHPVSGHLITATSFGVFRWSIDFHEQNKSFLLRFANSYLKTFAVPIRRYAALTPDGRYLAMTAGGQVAVRDLKKNRHKRLAGRHSNAKELTISADGKWVVTFDARGLKLWNVPKGKIEKDLWPEHKSGFAKFSPDGRWLVASFRGMLRVLDTDSWKLVRTMESERPIDDCAFSPRTDLMALSISGGKVRLFASAVGKELAVLESAALGWKLAFSKDGTQLAQATLNGPTTVWDLREVRKELAEVELDWQTPPYPAAKPQARPSKELRIEGVPFSMELFNLRRSPPNEKKSLDFVRKYFKPGGQLIQGELTAKDLFDRLRKTCRHRKHKVNLMAGKAYAIELKSKAFDPFLRLEDSTQRTLMYHDDIDYKNNNKNSLLLFVPEQTAEYWLIVTSYEPSMGDYTLTIRSAKSRLVNRTLWSAGS